MLWPPSFCKKGSPDCIGPYVKRSKWVYNKDYEFKGFGKAVGKNIPYFKEKLDYEIGYNWTKAKKFRNMML